MKIRRPEVDKHLARTALSRLTEDDVPHLGTASPQTVTWSTVSGFKGLENDVVVVVGVEALDDDWYSSLASAGMSRARTRQYVLSYHDADKLRQDREAN